MDLNEIETFCLGLPGAQQVVQWGGVRVFFVGPRKMFATLHLQRGSALAFKVEPDMFLGFCDRPGIRPAPYLARAHWISLEQPNALAPAELRELLERSHQLVVRRLPKRQQIGLLL